MPRVVPVYALAALLSLAGCRQPASVRAPEPVRLEIPTPKVTEGSLWQEDAGREGVIADTRARVRGDLLTILVIEDVTAKRDRQTDTSRTQKVDAGLDQFFYADWLKHKGELPKVKLNSSRSFSGGGKIEEQNQVRATLTAQVTERLPNGNMMILGQKKVLIAGDTQVITLTGIVRPEDILPQNTVLSSNIAEARINIHGSGTLSDAQRRTLVGRLFDWINLF